MSKNIKEKFNARAFSPEQLGLMLLQEAKERMPDPARVRAMIKAGALLNQRDDIGNTPLILFMQQGEFAIARNLVLAGADTKVRNHLTNTALIFSEVHGQTKLTDMMRAKGARFRKHDRERIDILKTASMIEASHVAMFVQSGYEDISEREAVAAEKTRKMSVLRSKGRQP